MRYGAQDRQYIEEAAFEIECSKALGKRLGRSSSNLLVPAEVLTRPLPEEVMKRAMATTPGAKGGYMVGVTNMGFIDILRNRSVAMAMGARQLSGLRATSPSRARPASRRSPGRAATARASRRPTRRSASSR
jgi:hypothetical protein